jgi:hypothetical protein
VKKSIEALLIASIKVDLTVSTEYIECILTSLEDKGEKVTTK